MKQNAIIKCVMTTEKGTQLAGSNQFLLEVARNANKIEIRTAVEREFGVHVLNVRTQNYSGRNKVLRNRRVVQTPSWKRAIVTVREGERIEAI